MVSPTAAPYQAPLQHPFNEGLVLAMLMSENSGNKTYDSSRFGRVGTFQNNTHWETINNPNGPAINLDKTSDRILIAPTLDFGTDSITYIARVYVETIGARNLIFATGLTGNNDTATMLIFSSYTTNWRCSIEGSTSAQVNTTDDGVALSSGNWYTLGITFDRDANLAIRYVDGEQSGSQDDISSITGNVDSLGFTAIASNNNLNNGESFDGTMKAFCAWNRALSAWEHQSFHEQLRL